MYVFTCEHLSKHYKKVEALKELSLQLEQGKIYGLVGNNGAGKTTLMKVMMGLIRKTGGNFSLFGETTPKGIRLARRKIGALIETPIINDFASGYFNVNNVRILLGLKDKNETNRVLELMGLSDAAKRLAGNYSLGMRQRLGIAMALLGKPQLLVLDEPINGLDPSGIREIGELLTKLNQEEGTTILISSHYLNQLEQFATDYIFLHHGSIVQEISSKDLKAHCQNSILLCTEDNTAALKILQQDLPEIKIENDENNIILHQYDNIQKLYGILAKNRIAVLNLESFGQSLEDYFADLVGGRKN